jgi:hypothetical protein
MIRKYLVTGISITVVVLLVLGSLTNVIGYQSVKSTVNDSPLFQTRTQRATNQQQNVLTSQYLGMGKGNLLQIPTKDKRIEQLKEVIQFISRMDDKTFEQFTELYIQKVRPTPTLRDINLYEIIQALHLLKTEPEIIITSFLNRNNKDLMTIDPWIPGCIILYIIWFLFLNLLQYFTDYTLDCDPTYLYNNRNCLNKHIKF